MSGAAKLTLRWLFKLAPLFIWWLVMAELGYAIMNGIVSWNGPFTGWDLHGDAIAKVAMSGPEFPFWKCALITLIGPAIGVTAWLLMKVETWAETRSEST